MSDDTTDQGIDTGAEVAIPEGEVTHEQLVKILEDARAANPEEEVAEEPAAPPAEPEKPKDERVSARIIAARRSELKAAAERQAIAKQRAEAEELHKSASEVAKIAEQVKAAKLSPSKALELLGMDAKTFLETLANENEPEAIANRATQSVQTRTEQLEAELKAMREEREAEKRSALQQRDQAEVSELKGQFLEHVGSLAENYPYLVAEFTPQEIANLGWQTALEHASKYEALHGHPPDDDVIAQFLENQAKARAESKAAWRERYRKSAPTPPSQGTAIQGRPTQAVSPRTLTNGVSAQRAALPKQHLTQEEMDAESIRILQNLYSQSE